MRMKQLEYFICAVESKTFFDAANELFITQSTLSKQIQSLEKELGVVLFDRTKRSAHLTEQGKILYRKAPDLLREYKELQKLLSPSQFNIEIVVFPICEYYGINRDFSDFLSLNLEYNLQIFEMPNKNAFLSTLHGKFQLGIFRTLKMDQDTLKYRVIKKDSLVLLVSRQNQFSNRTVVSLSELKEESFLLLSSGTSLYEQSIQMCKKANFFPKIAFQGSSAESMLHLVIQNKGIAMIMGEVAKKISTPETTVVHFEETVESFVVLAHQKKQRLSVAAKDLVNYFESTFS